MIGRFPRSCDIVIAVEVSVDAGHPWGSLTGVTVEARAGLIGGATVEDATVALADGVLTISWPEWTFTAGEWRLEILGTKSGLTMPLDLPDDTFTVTETLKPAL